MRVAIVATGGPFDRQLQRVLFQHNINGDIVTTITPRVMEEYGCICLSDHNEIPNLPVLVERLILAKTLHVIYITQNPSIGQFYAVLNDMFFHRVNQFSMDVELPLLIRTIDKFNKPLQHLQHQHETINDKYETLRLTNKAKRILLDRGYTEEEAHQFIQKTAMDLRISKRRLVSLIIENKIDI